MFYFIFISNIIKINQFTFRCSSSCNSHVFLEPVPYGYDAILSKACNLLPSLLLSSILLISSVNTLCPSLEDLCCDFNMISLFS